MSAPRLTQQYLDSLPRCTERHLNVGCDLPAVHADYHYNNWTGRQWSGAPLSAAPVPGLPTKEGETP